MPSSAKKSGFQGDTQRGFILLYSKGTTTRTEIMLQGE